MGRFRRLRKNSAIRNLVRETQLTKNDLILPLFVVNGKGREETIAPMPGVFRYSPDKLIKQIEAYIKLGGQACLLFGVTGDKDSAAKEAYAKSGIVQKAVKTLKKEFPEFLIITDVCLCAYMNHGHCGVVHDHYVDNDKTLPLLAKMAVSHAEAGADIVAPSDMMDYRVMHIRGELDKNGFTETAILSYAVKYASSFYGPFRDAADSAPGFGDRRTYQMDAANQREALKEAKQDILEGADMVMVKPALAYLDVIKLLRDHLDHPIAAYNVSGEYAMVKAAADKKWIDEKQVVMESLTSMKRAGADIIITYHAADVLGWLNEEA